MTILRNAILPMLAMAAGHAMAQQSIDMYMTELERQPDVEVLYTERRNPQKELVKVSTIITFKSHTLYTRLLEAFERERNNTVTATRMNDGTIFQFTDDIGNTSYNLSVDDDEYILIKSWRRKDTE